MPAPTPDNDAALLTTLNELYHPLRGRDDLSPLVEQLANARIVMLGEASHGTSEFYVWRAAISRRLIEEHGFKFIAVEGDWPDCYRVNRYVKAYPQSGEHAEAVLHGFDRWPTWMWANWEMVAFAEWLRKHNADSDGQQVGFYGLDVYSLWESLDAIVRHLRHNDPQSMPLAEKVLNCFQPYGRDEQRYARHTALSRHDCANEVTGLLLQLARRHPHFDADPEADFDAEQNAHVMVSAERYYRTMMVGGAGSWNLRDSHMMETLNRLMQHHGPGTRAIVWAHNTHIGDARATDMRLVGMHNIGQLAREEWGAERVRLVGFGSHSGSVVAGGRWGAEMQRMALPPSPEHSWEGALHAALGDNGILLLDEVGERRELVSTRGHRAVGVVYDPRRERGNYVPTELARRYDAFVHLDETRALHPLHIEAAASATPPDTYPWGF
ncbi:Erythromycin esterase homolog [Microbulbifer donghaiensis]|uniref:Erythromycin esterase homolog n=1 Tax=Microbulbifer donghaiensis TaxID=494016 RepID=A0A1M5E5U7_9GAMM|nr:erythromycin esterase family protein [Microbulbifer donghaiensis]SHF74607.1 Erythromycin esterase homolog [Microbulbifer donghaiensis]